jgi:hypothetical protein
MKGIMPLSEFKRRLGIRELEFFKGRGRSFASTTVGNLYKATNLDQSKSLFVTVAGEGIMSKSGESLEGTLWLVNTVLRPDDVL